MTEAAIDSWNRLRRDETGDGDLEVPSLSTGTETGFGPVRYGVGSEGEARLLIPCGPATALSAVPPVSRLVTSIRYFAVAGRQVRFIDLRNLDASLETVFAELCGDIVRRIGDGEPPQGALRKAIEDFRDLLENIRPREISETKLIGLLGELLFMRSGLTIEPRFAESWTGPYDLRHDFRNNLRAFEVKTSGRSDATVVTINGVDQLDAPAGGELTLIHIRMERAAGGEIALSALVKELLSLGVDRDLLRSGLCELGCDDPDDPAWNALRFAPAGFAAYRVEPGFPRLTAASFPGGKVPDGVGRLSYEADLDFAKPFVLDSAGLDARLRAFAL